MSVYRSFLLLRFATVFLFCTCEPGLDVDSVYIPTRRYGSTGSAAQLGFMPVIRMMVRRTQDTVSRNTQHPDRGSLVSHHQPRIHSGRGSDLCQASATHVGFRVWFDEVYYSEGAKSPLVCTTQQASVRSPILRNVPRSRGLMPVRNVYLMFRIIEHTCHIVKRMCQRLRNRINVILRFKRMSMNVWATLLMFHRS